MISVPAHIASLQPYQPGKPVAEIERELGIAGAVKLASNENPLGTSPEALNAISRSLGELAYYPDGGRELRLALADRFVVKLENVICGSGSEAILATAMRTFLDREDEMISSEGTFIGFQVLARASGVKTHLTPLKNFGFDLPAMAARVNEKTKIIYIANPNNPTGTAVTTTELERFIAKVPESVLVILDEAYFEYADGWPDFPDSMKYRWDNVLTLRTFSKAYGLAGIRIGYGMAHSDLISKMLKVKLPFEPSTLAAAAGLGALGDEEFLQRTVALNRESLRYFNEEFDRLGLRYAPSLANFVAIDFRSPETVRKVYEALLRHGFITRPLAAFGLPAFMRISTGTMEQNSRFIEALEQVLREEMVH